MTTSTLTIASIIPPAPGKARGYVVGTNGAKIGCFAEKFGLFEVGQTYDIDVTDGQYQNVKAATLIAQSRPAAAQPLRAVPPSPAPSPAAGGASNGAYGNVSADTAEHIFVCGALNAALQSGQVRPDRQSVGTFVNVLRGVWHDSLGHAGAADQQYRARG